MLSRTRLYLAFGALVVAFGHAAGIACAQGTKTIINAATVPKYPPFEFKDPASGKLTGFDVEIVDAIAARMGIKVNWIDSSFDQLISSIETRRADIIVAGMADTPERRATVSFLNYLHANSVFFALRVNAARFPDLDALCGKRVATARRTIWPAAIEKWSDEHCVAAGKPAVIVVGTDGSPDTRLQLNQGRADAAVQGAETIPYQNTIEGNRYVILGKPFLVQDMGLGFARDDVQFGQKLKQALAGLMADGSYQELLRKWGLTDSAIEHAMVNGEP
ncbi:ABC transporter substrate-binding protein [Bradyrhizobium sp. CCGB01]|uniref:ABC transporter substrate-binding protein n=1 Tax=Bradyrhizobium sp. CCGB01 TaxID=2949634 RepID=UPI0020B339C1|nr:ABC transporter substrate-binding protein [Bradyrhizobium sp. CCGB01]MCP3411416.1 ABC transporter substrate-binding protein [Bradyrhizobium sp. CCGB01]